MRLYCGVPRSYTHDWVLGGGGGVAQDVGDRYVRGYCVFLLLWFRGAKRKKKLFCFLGSKRDDDDGSVLLPQSKRRVRLIVLPWCTVPTHNILCLFWFWFVFLIYFFCDFFDRVKLRIIFSPAPACVCVRRFMRVDGSRFRLQTNNWKTIIGNGSKVLVVLLRVPICQLAFVCTSRPAP